MLVVEPRALLRKLNAYCTSAMEAAASDCIACRHYEVTVEHLLLALIDDRDTDVVAILQHYKIDIPSLRVAIKRNLQQLRAGNAGKPVFSPLLFEWLQDGWLFASTELKESQVRSGALLSQLVQSQTRYLPAEIAHLAPIARDELRRDVATIAAESAESRSGVSSDERQSTRDGGPAQATSLGAPDGPLAKYTTDLTEKARQGKLDGVFGRENEIRQIIDTLVRRRKNNPIIVGEAGVGKTALVEGLALRIAEGTVPEQLKNVHVLALDLGALQAGSGIKGEFENRLKGVIAEVEGAPQPIVLFIDEAHTLIGAGGQQGGSDAANLLKPALARGELRTIAATTWGEYKRYFEKDAALERRFQPVKVEEPSTDAAIVMLRGLAKKFEETHGVLIQEEAVRAAVELSSRYISGRQLPDKAIDLLDTSAARVRVVRAAPSGTLEDARAERGAIERHIEALGRDAEAGVTTKESIEEELSAKLDEVNRRVTHLEALESDQRAIVERIDELRLAIKNGAGGEKKSAEDRKLRTELRKKLEQLRSVADEEKLIHIDVDEALVASIVADWTGIPVGKMVRDDADTMMKLDQHLRARVIGQDAAIDAIARELRAARSGLKPPNTPLGVFLLVGPSGVGKTETALGLADLLFGGERFLITINMSEFQERHSVSRLIGSPPGYVGFGSGGVLTEAVRQRPYSVVLLDEVEKADAEVMNLFYQVFDKGMLADGEGRVIDFKNTLIVLTSNLGADLISDAAPPKRPPPPLDKLVALVKPVLTARFKAALLARMTVVPYIPVGGATLHAIAKMKLDAVAIRTQNSHGFALKIAPSVVDAVASRCMEVDTGARNVDHILRASVLPQIANEILSAMADGSSITSLDLDLGTEGNVVCRRHVRR